MNACRYTTELVLILSTLRTLSNWPQSVQIEPDTTIQLGGWLFRHRTALPLPVAVAILALRIGEAPPSARLVAAGVAVTLLGELIRLWGVHHIGVISRTRSERLGPLVASGPFAILRNPLYVGNIALWVGFALTARLVWLAPVILLLLGLEYHAIVRWEERLLESRLGDAYRAYATRVPRWWPTFNRGARPSTGSGRADPGPLMVSLSNHGHSRGAAVTPHSLRETLFSERGTLLAIAAGYLLLWLKAQV
jgi:protein-S-isoprenylcysteine O-methyltransferase Ste14